MHRTIDVVIKGGSEAPTSDDDSSQIINPLQDVKMHALQLREQSAGLDVEHHKFGARAPSVEPSHFPHFFEQCLEEISTT